MKYYLIAGEASGDLYASHLMKELKNLDPEASFRAWGGDRMHEQGAELSTHYRQMNFMGFFEVLINLRKILHLMRLCRADLLSNKPDVLILVDFPGFNLRIARFAKRNGIKVFYYISPTVWAWHQSRVKQIRKFVDRLFVILPFEKEFFARFNIDVDFAGHPLTDIIYSHTPADIAELSNPDASNKPFVILLPGSRKQEITLLLPIMLGVVKNFPQCYFAIAAAPSQPVEFYKKIIGHIPVPIIYGRTYDLLAKANAAIVTSGTATLETALFRVPQVVCYRGSFINMLLAWFFVRVEHISLVNLILKKPAVAELIQYKCSSKTIGRELYTLLYNTAFQKLVLQDYEQLSVLLGQPGASARLAQLMYTRLKNG